MIENLLYAREVPITEQIKLRIPTVGEVLDNEELYRDLVSMLTASPIDYMVQLDDAGVDFSTINDYELFVFIFQAIADKDTSLIFKDMKLSDFRPMVDPKTKNIQFAHKDNGAVIDRIIHSEIARILRLVNNLVKDTRKPGNEEARQYMIERARIKQMRNARRQRKITSQFEPLVISLVNSGEFKYDFESVRDLTIYQFNACFKQVQKRVAFDNLMIGVYAGTVKAKELPPEQLSWVYTYEK